MLFHSKYDQVFLSRSMNKLLKQADLSHYQINFQEIMSIRTT